MTTHFRFGPSKAAVWLHCPYSVTLSDQITAPDDAGPAAREGTMLHAMAEQMLVNRRNRWPGQVGDELHGITVTAEHIKLVERTVAAVMVYADGAEDRLQAERWRASPIDPDHGGTRDVTIPRHDRLLVIADFKFGRVPVEAERNSQGLCYALDALLEHGADNFDHVAIVIVQPRAYDGRDMVSEWIVPVPAVLRLEHHIRAVIAEWRSGKAQPKPGDHCAKCERRVHCPAMSEFAASAVTASQHKPALLSDAALTDWLAQIPRLETWIKALRAEAIGRIQRGQTVTGWRLGSGGSVADWRDGVADRVRSYCGDALPLPSVAVVKKLLGPESFSAIADCVETTDRAPVLVPENSRRKAVAAGPAADFGS